MSSCAFSVEPGSGMRGPALESGYSGAADTNAPEVIEVDFAKRPRRCHKEKDSDNWKFPEGSEPQEAPTDTFFQFERSTVSVPAGEMAAFKLGNTILDLLRRDASSAMVEGKPSEFLINVKACANGACCDVIVQFYRSPGVYLVEFQRCAGDRAAFASWYSLMVSSLRSNFHAISVNKEPNCPSNKFEMQIADYVPEGCIQPLLDLARSDEPRLQLEAAIAFVSFRETPQILEQLVALPDVFACLTTWLQSCHVDVVVAAARALQVLSTSPNAKEFFAEAGWLETMHNQFRNSHSMIRDPILKARSNLWPTSTEVLL